MMHMAYIATVTNTLNAWPHFGSSGAICRGSCGVSSPADVMAQ